MISGIEQVRPWGVDVSTGVEEKPGIKDAMKVRAFIKNARSVDFESPHDVEPGPFDWAESGW